VTIGFANYVVNLYYYTYIMFCSEICSFWIGKNRLQMCSERLRMAKNDLEWLTICWRIEDRGSRRVCCGGGGGVGCSDV